MKKIILAMLFSVFLLSAMTVPSLSQDELTVGVNVGDWFLYKTTLVEYEADEGVPFPPSEYSMDTYIYNETDWKKYTVTDIVGSNVTLEVLSHWSNGTETTYGLELNITSSYGPTENLMVVQPNLEAGDQLREGYMFLGVWPVPPRIINETIMVDYATETRETNVLDWYFPIFDPQEGAFINNRLLWDKETGVLVKSESTVNLTMTADVWYFYKTRIELILLSVWVIPEYPIWTVLLLVFVAVTVSINLYIRKRLRH